LHTTTRQGMRMSAEDNKALVIAFYEQAFSDYHEL
jgi:hypothetical protein